jgi:UDP-N-acetylmuramyl pentapeptide phosphotransferase/UDP-N-acetylglucosamine-1-phosphate transferase
MAAPPWAMHLAVLLPTLIAAALLSVLLILFLKPLLVRYALARPNARSSHKVPTPQGGGIAVVGSALAVASGAMLATNAPLADFLPVIAATLALGLVGAVDDIRPLPAGLRLLLQFCAVTIVVATSGIRLLPEWLPESLEQALLVVGGVWFVNLVNFMDGLDWITVAEMVPVTAFLPVAAVLMSDAFAETMPPPPAQAFWASAALCGALLGFAVFNKPVAKLFLGDVGSLPIGLLVGWLLLMLARNGAVAAAILLPLYYLMDATITLLKRLARGERVWEAHRSHFYQQATVNGFSALSVSAHVFALNLVLAGLAAITLVWRDPAVDVAAILAGIVLVGVMLRHFAQPRPETAH